MTDYAAARRHMVDGQILPSNVTNPTLIEALKRVPREKFVPKSLRGVAYIDEDLEIADGRYLMEPMVFARLVEAARIRPTDAVLDVGCGLGYSAAVMGQLASVVVALEEDPTLAEKARRVLRDVEADSVVVIEDALTTGCPKQAPFDVIFLDGSVDEIPETFIDQLADGGRLVGVVNRRNIGCATLMTKNDGAIGDRVLFDAGTPPLPGFERKPAFQF